jgi:hypothetical protein
LLGLTSRAIFATCRIHAHNSNLVLHTLTGGGGGGVLNAVLVPPEGESRAEGVLEPGTKAEAPTERELRATGDGEAAPEPPATGAAAGDTGGGGGRSRCGFSLCIGALGGAPVDAEEDAAACAVGAGRGETAACAGDLGGTSVDAGGAAAGAAVCPVEGRLRLARMYARLDPVADGRMGSNLESSKCVNKRMDSSAVTGAWVYTYIHA